MNLAPRYDMNFQRYYSNLMDFLLNRRSPLLPRVNETQSQVQVLVQEPEEGEIPGEIPQQDSPSVQVTQNRISVS